MKLARSQRGDTIMEVIIAMAVLSLMLTASFALANKNSQANRQAAERSEGQKFTESQMEKLKTYISGNAAPDLPPAGSMFCMKNDGKPSNPLSVGDIPDDAQAETFTAFSNVAVFGDCIKDSRYFSYIERGGASGSDIGDNTYRAHTRWSRVSGGIDEATMVHRLYPDIGSTVNTTTVAVVCDPITQILVGIACTTCPTGTFPSGSFPPVCEPPVSLPSVTVNIPGDFPAWHIASERLTGRQTRIYTLTNTSSTSLLRVNTVDIGGLNQNAFYKSSDTCSNVTLPPASPTCTVTVTFYPLSGPTNNRFGNAGPKIASLDFNTSGGVVPTALQGWAVSDRLAPGDTMVASGDDNVNFMRGIRGYSPTCYNNAFSCNAALIFWNGGGLVLYNDTNTNSATWGSGYTGGDYAAMQGDGNLCIGSGGGNIWCINDPGLGAPVVGGAWLKIYNGGALRLMNPNWNSNPDNGALWSAPGW